MKRIYFIMAFIFGGVILSTSLIYGDSTIKAYAGWIIGSFIVCMLPLIYILYRNRKDDKWER